MIRADLSTYKSQLKEKQAYWSALKQFFKGNIKKQELDKISQDCLIDTKLHNEFIFAILHNAKPEVYPPPDFLSNLFSSSLSEEKDDLAFKKFKRNCYFYLNREQKDFWLNHEIRDDLAEKKKHLKVTSEFNNVSLCAESLSLPDLLNLKTRMNLFSKQEQINSISDESILLVYASLQYHLKRLISTCLEHTKSFRTRGVLAKFDPNSIDHPLLKMSNLKGKVGTTNNDFSEIDEVGNKWLDLRDFYFCILMNPGLLKVNNVTREIVTSRLRLQLYEHDTK